MSDDERFLGVAGFAPLHAEAMADLRSEDRERLRGLVGRRLERVWVEWDVGDDEWFVDAPVALDFGDAGVLELAAFKLHLCLSWDSIDLDDRLVWYGDAGLDLRWRANALDDLEAVRGGPVTSVELIEYGGALNGIALRAGDRYAELTNARDELGTRAARDADADVTYRSP